MKPRIGSIVFDPRLERFVHFSRNSAIEVVQIETLDCFVSALFVLAMNLDTEVEQRTDHGNRRDGLADVIDLFEG